MSAHQYDAAYDPPLPVIPFLLGSPSGDDRIHLTGVADTGADITVVPAAVAERMLAAIGTIRVAGLG
ncbi:MAG: hypothetical protein ACRDJM_03095, partial [Actinomycetota bacterium]